MSASEEAKPAHAEGSAQCAGSVGMTSPSIHLRDSPMMLEAHAVWQTAPQAGGVRCGKDTFPRRW